MSNRHADAQSSRLLPVTRPNGAIYAPRKISTHPVDDRYGDDLSGVVVFGTHDPEMALPHANAAVRAWIDSGYEAVDPQLIWWGDGFSDGQRSFITDPEQGRAGVYFNVADLPFARAGSGASGATQ